MFLTKTLRSQMHSSMSFECASYLSFITYRIAGFLQEFPNQQVHLIFFFFSRTSTSLIFLSPPGRRSNSLAVVMDNGRWDLPMTFNYVENPTVVGISTLKSVVRWASFIIEWNVFCNFGSFFGQLCNVVRPNNLMVNVLE